jgi:hypothetical protein
MRNLYLRRRDMTRNRSSRIAAGFVLLVLVAALASCGGGGETPTRSTGASAPEPVKEVALIASDSSIEFPKTLEAEPLSINFENKGKKAHTAFFARINEGITLADLRGIKSDVDFFSALTLAARMPDAKPGETTSLTAEFPPGRYVVLREEDEVHARFNVSGASGAEIAQPKADLDVTVGEFYFDMPSELAAGEITLALTNVGEQGHEMIIADESKKKEFGLFYAPAPGGEVWYEVTLEPGTYIAACQFTDPKTGKAHFDLGMSREFTVE